MNLAKTFPNPALLSHVSLVGMTYEGVTPSALAWLRGLVHAWASMWRHVSITPVRLARLSHSACWGATGGLATLHHVFEEESDNGTDVDAYLNMAMFSTQLVQILLLPI
jgi:hypothetical protein